MTGLCRLGALSEDCLKTFNGCTRAEFSARLDACGGDWSQDAALLEIAKRFETAPAEESNASSSSDAVGSSSSEDVFGASDCHFPEAVLFFSLENFRFSSFERDRGPEEQLPPERKYYRGNCVTLR